MMNKLTIQNNKLCKLELVDNPELLRSLKQLLSFKLLGVEYTQAYKMGWDGWTCLFNKNNTFPLGLLGKVQQFLSTNQVTFEVVDKRKPLTITQPMDITAGLTAAGLTPRDYQEAMVDVTVKNRKGIIRACTGCGKSLSAAMITARHNRPTIIYVIGLDLLQQFHDLFSKLFNEPIGYIGNGVCDIQRINIASIWTVGKALDSKFKIFDEEDIGDKEKFNDIDKYRIQQLLQATELHIIDECHLSTCDTIKNIYKHIDPTLIYGMSATPSRGDGQDLYIEGLLGEQIINVPASLLIQRKLLAQPIIKFIDVPSLAIHSRTYASVYGEYIVENELRNSMVVHETRKMLDKGYQILILFKQIKHGRILQEYLTKHNIECAILDGRNSLAERIDIKEQLLAKKLHVVLASTIYDLGVDIVSLSGLILAGGGNSPVRTIQRIGRVIRGFPGKNIAAVVDFYDQARFLKNHSVERYKSYAQEPGFHIIPSTMMKRHLCL